MSYLFWYDDNAKKPSATKIAEACAAYTARFAAAPTVVLLNEADRAEVSGVQVQSKSYIRPNNFWVGREEPQL